MKQLYQADIVKCKHHHDGTWFMIRVPEWYADMDKVPQTAELRLDDGRKISAKQRAFLYALFGDINKERYQSIKTIKETLKSAFVDEYECEPFSLSDVDMTTANEFIEFVLNYVFENEIQLSEKAVVMAREVNNFLYLCLVHRKCAVCGIKSAHIHHIDAVGAGRDRTKIDHTQHRLVALCVNHHKEAHDIGWLTFAKRYIVDGIKVNKEMVKKLGI